MLLLLLNIRHEPYKKRIESWEHPTEMGVIMLRCIRNETTDEYWQECYRCIRKIYPTIRIVIIDDNSEHSFLSTIPLHNTIVIHTEYKGRGELLPYYYYATLGSTWFKQAIIIHDSVFMKKQLPRVTDPYKILWTFDHIWNNPKDEIRVIQSFKDNDLVKFYQDQKRWTGCFGGMSIVTYDYIVKINKEHPFSVLLDVITNRKERMCFERIIACLFHYHSKHTRVTAGSNPGVLYGTIQQYCQWEYSYQQYLMDKNNDLPLVKVWSGR
jgi:hypothetical protein